MCPFLGYLVCDTGCDLRFCVARGCAQVGGLADVTDGLSGWGSAGRSSSCPWSRFVAFAIEPGDEFAVDLAGGGEFLIALGEPRRRCLIAWKKGAT